jgi:hypothetical protein
MRPGVGFNMRTGEYLSLESRQEKKDPKNDPRIKNALGLLGHKYDSWLDNPPGYPEVKELTKRVMKKPTIKFIDLSTAVSAGEYIIFYSNMSHLHACKVSSLEPIRDMGLKGGYRVLSDRNNSSLEISEYDHSSRQKPHDESQVVDGILPLESEFILDKKRQGVWKISEEEFTQLIQYGEIKYDPSIEYPLSREEYAIACALDGMAFDRWGASIESIKSQNPTRYKDISEDNLRRAISNLVSRFGEPALINAVKWNTLQHLFRLHIPKQKTEIIGAQNNAFGDVHSDILGFKRDLSRLATELTGNSHPLVADMEHDGYGPVGYGVYNASTIVGDIDMLRVLKTDYPDTFSILIKYLAGLVPMNQGDWYGNSTIFPIRAIKEYFPRAFEYINANYIGTIPNEDGPGIEFPNK